MCFAETKQSTEEREPHTDGETELEVSWLVIFAAAKLKKFYHV